MNERGFRWTAAALKLHAIARVTVRQQLAYKTDFLLRSVFLLFILYVFVQLWTAAYDGDSSRTIAGFTLKQIVWYLAFTEALTMAGPPLGPRIEEEVKSGDIAVKLTKPLSYVGYHYSSYMAEALFRFAVHLAVGSTIAWSTVGAPAFGLGWMGLLTLSLGAVTVAFLLSAVVALLAFWVEETRGMEFVMQKLQFTIGGMLLPIDLMPEWLQRVCAWLPFQAALYFPAGTAVHFQTAVWLKQLGTQAGWIAGLSAAVIWVYRRGVKKLHVNGG
ncbi:ABC transporter permease [Cohnella sp. CFH 77786]|uniref:ABC transporter permease n=1 Tax=Cohnella sp. CFH 77786 TaxID=2662265 RepID=UPI001C60C35C|nr:ABC-2 family transporter protein [Cohnella sp. CFH 77786]MBW5444774.1 ABC transporter permease [Cohnella sp. CFH 77786]